MVGIVVAIRTGYAGSTQSYELVAAGWSVAPGTASGKRRDGYQ